DFLLPFQTRRGCPMNCSYCSTSTIEGEILRKRAPDLVVQEITRQVEKNFDRFFFVDNTFNLPPSYATELCQQLAAAELDITWRCILYPWKIDEKLVRLMVKAGCREVSLGFESGYQPILQSMNKKYNSQEVRQITQILGDHGIHRMGFLLLGGPGETKESAEESLQFADSLDLEVVKITTGIRIYPHTALERIALAEGVISEDDDLLQPRFYLAEGLEDWLPETVHSWLAERPHWVT
ncbi:MAG: radical SAM protein, partial [Syntrophobacterales bacterium]